MILLLGFFFGGKGVEIINGFVIRSKRQEQQGRKHKTRNIFVPGRKGEKSFVWKVVLLRCKEGPRS